MGKLRTGDSAPDFTLLNQDGKYVRLADFIGKKVLLYFYPKAMTPGCTVQACNIRDAFHQLRDLNVVSIGINADKPERLRKFSDHYKLPFPLLSDESHQTLEAYGVWDKKSLYGKIFFGIIRSSFLIDESGVIIDCHYKVRPDMTAQLALDKLKN